MSAKPRVGTTTSAFVLGELLASRLKLRAIVVGAAGSDATARLARARRRADRSLENVLDDLERLHTPAELNRYVARSPTGLHVLAAADAGIVESGEGLDRYGELVAFLSCFYEVVLLDLGAGVVGASAQLARGRADQVVCVTTPEWIAASGALVPILQRAHDRTTVAINQSRLRPADVLVIAERYRGEHPHRAIRIPHDQQLAGMLDSATYTRRPGVPELVAAGRRDRGPVLRRRHVSHLDDEAGRIAASAADLGGI